ncbi:penicillin-binding protein 2A [Virgibacillus natechei]|uniref:Penicillin-binding protein 2A n=1 Tax=Virgibacillus natechei TaxID=1216297 RepID=A0ABS4IG40_9BACI|nr:transglycosylase domain-containing protein [Virgibacillus natechei]MBP1968994.1 penicillin-binding protein 2A [Virgibacillus natechei]UZD14270.1 penicillin-binding protein [Virgibacillus natechei]
MDTIKKRSDKHKDKHNKKRSFISKLKIFLFILIVIVGVGFSGYAAILVGGNLIVDAEDLVLDETTTVETADGEAVSKLYDEDRSVRGIDEIPKHVQDAFISIEDRRFYEHSGVDFKSVFRAVIRNIFAMSKVEGGSTITQQLSKNLFLSNDKTWTRKAKEVMAAVHLERKLSKNEIFELYLNEIYFGDGVYGIERASNYFFSKSVDDLTIAEGALLAGLAKGPNGYSPINHPERALDRRNVVLNAMEDTGVISTETRIQEQEKGLGLDVQERQANAWVDSYIDLVMKEAADDHDLSVNELKRGGYRIVINMDEKVQRIAYDQFQHDDYFPGNTEGAEGAFVMMEQETGKIVSAIGGRDYQIGDLNRVTVERQPGSIMKPIAVYAPAMMQLERYTPYSLIPDYQYDYDGYTVANVDNQFDGSVTIYDALKKSKNTSAVWLLDQIGVDYSKDYLEQLGVAIEDDGLPIALGGLTDGLAPVDLMESYGAFARNGDVIESSTIERIYDKDDEMIFQSNSNSREVFSPQVAWDMTEILTDTVESGTAAPGEFSKALAGKTGSTQHALVEGETNDAWFVGYTPEYTTALWMGYDKLDEDNYLTAGSEYPTRLTKSILTEMDSQELLAENFTKPDDVDALPEPIELPQIAEVQADYSFGVSSLGKLTWQGSPDDRVIYRIYREQEGIDERAGEVKGETEFNLNVTEVFQSNDYYVVPYDPLTKLEGDRSESVSLTW